jgi:hypothetical protein
MQAFNINGVQVLKQGISGLGLSTDEMKTKLATALGITEDAAAKLINAWKTGMRDAGASTDGFTHTVINGVEVITPALKSLKGSIDAVSDSARANAESMIFMGDKWVSASELGKKVAQTVGSYEAPFKAATGATAEQTKALDSLMMSAKEFQRVYGGSMEDARAVTSKAGKAWEDASVSAKMFGSDLKTMEGSFMEGMKGMTVSGEVYIAMLSQMGALQSDVARAAAALGYEEIGINNFVSPEFKKNYQGGATQALLDQMDKYFQDKIAADAKALEAHTASVEAATHKYDDLMIMVNGVMMSIKDYNELAKKVADDANKHQLESLGELTIGSKEASDAIGDLANASTLAAGNLGTITNNVSSTADMWRSFPDQMATAQSQTIKNLLDLGTNFYDAVDAANNLVDGFDEAAAKIQRSGSIGTISDVTSGSPQSYDATFKNLLNLGMNFYDAKDAINRMVQGADEAAMKLPQSAQIMKTTVDSTVGSLLKLGMNFYDAVDATRNLVIGFDKATAVLNPTASIGRGNPIFPDSQYQLGISGAYRTGDVSAGTGLMGLRAAGSGVTINVTGNTIMDQGTVNSLTNRVATQMTNILRMNAGLKV